MGEENAAAVEFRWNAEEALKLLDRGYRVVLTKDGLGGITALAVPKGTGLSRGLREWREFEPAEPVGREWTIEDAQREVFEGPNKYSGCGHSVAQALHCLAEKAVFHRLPDGKGGFHTPPQEQDQGGGASDGG
jgi:hypothetical protein